MDPIRFDKLTRRLATLHARRTVLRGAIAGGAVAASVPAAPAGARQATPTDVTPESVQASWLLVVGFSGAELVAADGSSTLMTVTLSGVDTDAVAFTDHPQRQFSLVQPEQVVTAINDAAADPLNAALVARMPLSRESEQVVVVLQSASVDPDAETLTLQVEVISAEATGTPVTIEPGQTTVLRGGNLFVDGIEFRRELCAGRNEACLTRICCPGLHCTIPFGAHCVRL
jgi:hypothetical protein